MNLKEVVQEFCRRQNLPIPNSVVSNTDSGVRQMWGLLNELIDDLLARQRWQANTREVTWNTTAAQDQGDIRTIGSPAVKGFQGIVPDTFFNRTSRLPVYGPLGPEDWARLQANSGLTGIGLNYRIRNNKMLLTPTPAAGQTLAFEYYSDFFLDTSASDVTPVRYWTTDDNVLAISDTLPILWLRYAWRKTKGLDYAEEFRLYEQAVNSLGSRQETSGTLSMSGGNSSKVAAGIIIPIGAIGV